MIIHFICRGNVLRSLTAETYLKSLNIPGIYAVSSGTDVDWDDPQEQEYFNNTLTLLNSHGIKSFAKQRSDQLTQQRLDEYGDIVILMNQRVIDEAIGLVQLPASVLNWGIIDIGEGHRTNKAQRESYEEEIYQDIVQKVNELVKKLTTK